MRRAAPVWIIVLICSGLPLAWLAWQIIANPAVLVEAAPDWFRMKMLARTLSFNGAAAVIATVLGLPVGIVLGRGRGVVAKVLWVALPVSLLLPSITYAYGWSQFLRLLNATPAATGAGDVLRCVWTLATWLWPIPAAAIGIALRRMDVQLQLQALLDGALWRVTLRELAGVIASATMICTVLATQEFAVYEPSGISVVATEVRMVFETGAVSSPENPITAPLGGGAGAGGGGDGRASAADGASDALPSGPPDASAPLPATKTAATTPTTTSVMTPRSARAAQRVRAGAAVATALPLLLVIAILSIPIFRAARTISTSEEIDVGPWPPALDAGVFITIAAVIVVIVAVIVPAVSLILSLHVHRPLGEIFDDFAPQISGTLLIATLTGIAAIALAIFGAVSRVFWPLVIAIVTFLIGGQLIAIAQIQLYNRGGLSWVYNAWPIMVMAYLSRFGWIALMAGGATWSPRWRGLRDLAAVDGAGATRTAASVVWPIAWPLLVAAGVLVMVLGLTEVPATLLISPQRPPMLTPMLMTWVHMLRYDAMIEASLLLMSVAALLGVVVALLVAWGIRGFQPGVKGSRAISAMVIGAIAFVTVGCGDATKPEAIWCETGTGPSQVVYPRAIAYRPQDDSFFVIDRMARVQHLNRKGECITEWRMPEWHTGKPVGVSIGPDGNVYIPDTHYQRIMVYTPQGELLRKWGSSGNGPGQFIFPTDVAFDSKGNVFVSEYGDNDRIQVFNQQGEYLYQFGKFGKGPTEFMRPQSMVIDDKDVVYVTDACNHRIQVFKTDGTFVKTLGQAGSGLGEFRYPYGLDQDASGNLIVCEFGNNRVQLIDKETGRGLKTWGSGGHDPGQLAYPWGVAVDRHEKVVAVDAGNNRLQVFEF